MEFARGGFRYDDGNCDPTENALAQQPSQTKLTYNHNTIVDSNITDNFYPPFYRQRLTECPWQSMFQATIEGMGCFQRPRPRIHLRRPLSPTRDASIDKAVYCRERQFKEYDYEALRSEAYVFPTLLRSISLACDSLRKREDLLHQGFMAAPKPSTWYWKAGLKEPS